jgi:hypothetical protein
MKYKYLLSLTFLLLTILSACKKDDESTTFYYDETSCSDPWELKRDDSEEEQKETIKQYLSDQKVRVQDIQFEINPDKVQQCEACHCTTGRIVVINVNWFSKRKMKDLDFYQ